MKKIGLTGGIGSGKSTVAKIFEILEVPVFYADDESKKLMVTDAGIRANLIQAFGPSVYIGEQLNRSYLSGLVFNDRSKLDVLNSIIHPAIIRHAQEWMNAHEHYPYAIKEAALIFESGSDKELDLVIGVYAPENIRIQRAAARDKVPPEKIIERLKSQWNEEDKMKRCDFVITNDDKQALIPQVLAIHATLIK